VQVELASGYAQELLQTFATSLGEVALRPSIGGTFIITLETLAASSSNIMSHLIWDRKRDGGFPETKELKKRVRDIIEPNRDLGHVDGKKSTITTSQTLKAAANIVHDPVFVSKKQDDRGESIGVQAVATERHNQVGEDRNYDGVCEECAEN